MRLKITLSDAQEQGVSFLLDRQAGALFYATGSGKSVIQIKTAFESLSRGIVDKFIIVATVSSALEIKNDFKKHTDVTPFVIDNITQLQQFTEDSSLKIAIVRYNKLMRMVSLAGKLLAGLSDTGNDLLQRLFTGYKIGCTFDECRF